MTYPVANFTDMQGWFAYGNTVTGDYLGMGIVVGLFLSILILMKNDPIKNALDIIIFDSFLCAIISFIMATFQFLNSWYLSTFFASLFVLSMMLKFITSRSV